jgi:YaiO family outer membrane protein
MKIPALILLALALLPTGVRAQAEATRIQEEAALQRRLVEPVELIEEEAFKRWILVPSFSWSFFNKGRDSWQQEDIQLMYRVTKTFLIGAEIDLMQRPPAGNDIMYSAFASWYPWKFLEVHSKLSFTPDPDFSPDQIYAGGFEWQVMPRLTLLFDYQQFNFSGQGPVGPGSIEQLRPGLTLWYNDDIFFTIRYARGWAFNDFGYNYYSGTLNWGNLPGGGRLTVGFAYGTDPDLDFGTNETGLSPAYTYSLFYRQPITKDLSVFGGVQYVYRLKQDSNDELYQQLTPTLGLIWAF